MRKLIASFFFVCFLSCNHDDVIVDEDVWVRIENSTAVNFDNTSIGSVGYSTVPSSGLTEYKLMPFKIYGGGCDFTVNGQHVTVGAFFCGSPPPPYFPAGRYTFKVVTAQPPNTAYRVEVIVD